MHMSNIIATTVLSCALLAYSLPMRRADGTWVSAKNLSKGDLKKISKDIAAEQAARNGAIAAGFNPNPPAQPVHNAPQADDDDDEGEEPEDDFDDLLHQLEMLPPDTHEDLLAELDQDDHEEDQDQHDHGNVHDEDSDNENNEEVDEDHSDHPAAPTEAQSRIDDLLAELDREPDGNQHTTTTTHPETHDSSTGDAFTEAEHDLAHGPHPE